VNELAFRPTPQAEHQIAGRILIDTMTSKS
jgi:hypothetical protein